MSYNSLHAVLIQISLSKLRNEGVLKYVETFETIKNIVSYVFLKEKNKL